MRRINIAEDKMARLRITDRIWSRTAVRHYKSVEHLLDGVLKISEAKKVLRKWIKENVPLSEQFVEDKILGA